MLTTIKFRNIPTIAFSQKYNAKIFYDVDIRDSSVNILEFRILKSGDINFQPIVQTINYNGEYIKITPEVPARLFANAGYQISARVGSPISEPSSLNNCISIDLILEFS